MKLTCFVLTCFETTGWPEEEIPDYTGPEDALQMIDELFAGDSGDSGSGDETDSILAPGDTDIEDGVEQ